MKRILSILLSLTICLTLLPAAVPVHAASVNNLSYDIISGQVTITDCKESASGSLTIPNTIKGYPVTSIGDKAFLNCTSLTSVTIPDSVTSIGGWAFSDCTSLTNVTIGDSVTSIGDSAFSFCYNLTSVTIGDSVTSIGRSAFDNCTSLQYNVYGAGKYLGNNTNPYVVLMDTMNTSITNIDIHSDTKIIGYAAFYNCTKLTSVTIPDSVTSIGDHAFFYCTRLTSVTIPDSVTSIGNGAFCNCTSLTSVTIPDSVTSIGEMAFYNCPSLIGIYFVGNAPSISTGAFYGVTATAYYHAGTSGWADATPGKWAGKITLQEVDHIWSPYTYDNNHTCTINGTERATCISCGAADVREVPDTAAHRYVDGICSLCGLKGNYGFLCGSLTTFGEGNTLLELYTAGERVYSQELVDGVYETEDVPQGEYILSVSKAGHTTQTCTITVGEGETLLNIKLYQKGDVTGDGRLNMADVARVFAHVRGKNPITDDYVMLCADATGDGRINIGDVAKIYTLIKSK